MKKKLVFLCGTLLLLTTLLASSGGIGVVHEQDIQSEVDKTSLPLGLSVYNYDYTVASSANSTIVLENPTFQEMKDFILKDTTSRKTFILYTYECRHFATEVNNNAKAAGWQCGFALLCYTRGQHAVVAFDTVDRGLIFIEPQTDAAIDVKVGGTYQGQEIKEILIAW
ncbi:MAG: hypothetical protein JW845_04035 [Dehalococcoidales bacterium]|nr:hypothetical protein [Dehalococcoidales bacterium]